MSAQAEQKSTVLIRLPLEDKSVIISVDKMVYFPGDTVHVSTTWDDTEAKVYITPILTIEGTTLDSIAPNEYIAVIPRVVTPGSYRIHLNVLDSRGRRLVYETDCVVVIDENQDIERIEDYVFVGPEDGSIDLRHAVTLSRDQMRKLRVDFKRERIQDNMGPQYLTIKTSILSRNGTVTATFERRIVIFRYTGDPTRDMEMFLRYRTAYGAYAVIHPEETERVRLLLDSLPNWSVVKLCIEPDYVINIGAVDQSNSVTRYYRVKGPSFEMGFTLGVPKVLYDTQAKDSMEYGKTSAMLRFYYVSSVSGHRFPVSFGIGTFGVNSPIDVDKGQGGFAASFFLDVIELARRLNWNIGGKASAGLELTPFIPIKKRSRILFDAHVGLTL
ncbi:MAG TPA: hypothetical protein DEO84_08865 [candidate division Zixibacteria bacterium]|nr:hypothetical protein [candidate division Zixibacteria bacterium]